MSVLFGGELQLVLRIFLVKNIMDRGVDASTIELCQHCQGYTEKASLN